MRHAITWFNANPEAKIGFCVLAALMVAGWWLTRPLPPREVDPEDEPPLTPPTRLR